jgi:hypothetical protein
MVARTTSSSGQPSVGVYARRITIRGLDAGMPGAGSSSTPKRRPVDVAGGAGACANTGAANSAQASTSGAAHFTRSKEARGRARRQAWRLHRGEDAGPSSIRELTFSIGEGADAIGKGAFSTGEGADAIGEVADAIGAVPFSIGTGAFSIGQGAFSIGKGADAIGEGAFSIGQGADAIGEGADAIGKGADAIGKGADAIGKGADAIGKSADAIGEGADAIGEGADAIGEGADAIGEGADAIGEGADAIGEGADAIGKGADAIGKSADAIGDPYPRGASEEQPAPKVRTGARHPPLCRTNPQCRITIEQPRRGPVSTRPHPGAVFVTPLRCDARSRA